MKHVILFFTTGARRRGGHFFVPPRLRGEFKFLFAALFLFLLAACDAPRRAGAPVTHKPPATTKPATPRREPIDTIRWAPAPNAKPPIGPSDAPGGVAAAGQTYRIAYLLPFLTNQTNPDDRTVPEKSLFALQFFGGAKLALQKLSSTEGLNLSVDAFDTQVADADFQRLLSNPRIDKAQVLIGPIRPSHLSLMAERIKTTHQILLSPESPNMNLTSQNPDFIQVKPSLRAHCAAIARYVLRRHRPEAVTLVCKQREAERLAYFRQPGQPAFAELIVPDATANFDNIDLRPYLRPGRTAVFALPHWASQDFVMAFFRKLRAVRGATPVEVYGMPQWKNFENIEPEYFSELNVHIASASYIDANDPEEQAFRRQFYQEYGTIPDDDAYNGYDVTMLTGQMLKKYGLSFPQYLPRESVRCFRGSFRFAPVFPEEPTGGGTDNALSVPDYLENGFVHILKFQNYRFSPAE